jgi:hypothetical protein
MRKFALVVAFGLISEMGRACTLLSPFDIDQIAGAEIVLVGKVTGYLPVEDSWNAALVTVEVEEVLKGRAPGEVTFVWNGGMAQGPHEARARGRVLIGAMQGGRIAVGDRTSDARPDLPSIVQPYCGEVWMVPASRETVADARKVLQ